MKIGRPFGFQIKLTTQINLSDTFYTVEIFNERGLETSLPRIIQRHKTEDFDPWEIPRLSFTLFGASALCLIFGVLIFSTIFAIVGIALFIFGSLLFLFSIPMVIQTLFQIRKHKNLVRYGKTAVGEVIESEGKNCSDGMGGYHEVSYKFLTQEGKEIIGRWAWADKPFWRSSRGRKFCVLYKPSRPSCHIAYECALYEVKSQASLD